LNSVLRLATVKPKRKTRDLPSGQSEAIRYPQGGTFRKAQCQEYGSKKHYSLEKRQTTHL
jgi:hypothetical protein